MPVLCTSRKMARGGAIYIYLKVRHDHTVAGKDLVSGSAVGNSRLLSDRTSLSIPSCDFIKFQ